jgi:hypothetical protein
VVRPILGRIALVGVTAVATAVVSAPAHAAPSPYCWSALTASSGVGSCQGAAIGGSWYRVHVTCEPASGMDWETGGSSPATYAPPNQQGIVATAPCPTGWEATGVWVNTY